MKFYSDFHWGSNASYSCFFFGFFYDSTTSNFYYLNIIVCGKCQVRWRNEDVSYFSFFPTIFGWLYALRACLSTIKLNNGSAIKNNVHLPEEGWMFEENKNVKMGGKYTEQADDDLRRITNKNLWRWYKIGIASNQNYLFVKFRLVKTSLFLSND